MDEAATFKINRAPVLTLWAAIAARRLGFDHDEALTLGHAMASFNTFAKGKRLGIFKPSTEGIREIRYEQCGGEFHVELLYRAALVMMTPDGIMATSKGNPLNPAAVKNTIRANSAGTCRYGRGHCGNGHVIPGRRISRFAYRLYQQFRPEIPAGAEKWEAAGELDLEVIRQAGRR